MKVNRLDGWMVDVVCSLGSILGMTCEEEDTTEHMEHKYTYSFIIVDAVFHPRLEPAQTNLWWAGKELRTPIICWIRAK